MAIQYDFSVRPMSPGESRDFTLNSASPAQVHVRCFVSSPPPPGYKPCAECGSYSMQQGQTIPIEANRNLFSRARGGLEIEVQDSDGDVIKIRVDVVGGNPDSINAAIAVAR